MILNKNVQSAYDISTLPSILNYFDDIIVNKVIYIQPIYVEPCLNFSILSYKS